MTARIPSKTVSDAQFRRDVAKEIHTTDGIWSPDTSKLTKVAGKNLPSPVKKEFNRLAQNIGGGDADAFTTKVDGRSVYLVSAFDTDVGGGINELLDAKGKALKMGDVPHVKTPLPHSEEPAVPVSNATYLADLKDAMRYTTQTADTPVITGKQIPARIAAKVEKMEAEKDQYGMKNYDSVEVHLVRIDGRNSYLIFGNAEEGQSQEMFNASGHKLDVMI